MTQIRAEGTGARRERSRELLAAYLDAESESQTEAALAELLEAQAQPLIASIVRSKLGGGSANSADIEDVCSDAIVAVYTGVTEYRDAPDREALADFDGFVAVIAYRACSAFYRRVRPEFHRLRNRLRYLLESQPDFALWEDSSGEWLCGLARWQPAAGRPALARVRLAVVESCASGDPVSGVTAAFRQAAGPVPFDDLARAMAQAWGVQDRSPTPVLESLPVASAQPSAQTGLELRQWVERLWKEIGELPVRQRVALLLSLRDANGESVTALLAVTRVAALESIAAAVDFGLDDFARIWKQLPWSDLQIAERLQLTRQQVINLRKCARERLSRRLLGARGNVGGVW